MATSTIKQSINLINLGSFSTIDAFKTAIGNMLANMTQGEQRCIIFSNSSVFGLFVWSGTWVGTIQRNSATRGIIQVSMVAALPAKRITIMYKDSDLLWENNGATEVQNGSLTNGNIYCISLYDNSISDATPFCAIFNPMFNGGTQTFGTVLSNANHEVSTCTAKFTLTNGTLSISDAYRTRTGETNSQSWNVQINAIHKIS